MNEYGLPYTLTAPGGTMQFNPAGYNENGYYLVKDGISFGAEIRASSEGRGQAHGSHMDDSFEEGIVGSMQWLVVADTVANRHLLIDNAKKVLRSMLGEEGTGTLEWTPADGSEDRRVSDLRLTQAPQVTSEQGVIKQMAAAMQSTRSTAESATEQQLVGDPLTDGGGGLVFPMTFPITFDATGSGALTIEHIGTATAYPVFEIHGGCTTPQIVVPSLGKRIALTGSIAAGETIEVDLFERTIKLNGTVNRFNLLDRSASEWFGIPADTTLDVYLAAGSWEAGAHLECRMRNAYA